MIKLFRPSRIITHDETLRVTRVGDIHYVDGKPVHRDLERFEITCNVQPLNGRDLLLVPEGDRFKEQYWVWMNQVDRPLLVNDKVTRDMGEGVTAKFQVQGIENWGSYTRARIVRIDVGPGATP